MSGILIRFVPILFVCGVGLCERGRIAHSAEIIERFKGGHVNKAIFRYAGPGASKAIVPDQAGVRITLTKEHANKPAVGLALHSALKGDFDASVDFEFIKVEKPESGNGAGMTIQLATASRTHEAATIGCVRGVDGGTYFFSHRATTQKNGQRIHSGGEAVTTSAVSGKLRLKRVGSTLYYGAETAGLAYDIYECELGEEDVNGIQFGAENGGSPTLVDIRIVEIRMTADDVGEAELPPPRVRWFSWRNSFVCLSAVGGFVLAIALYKNLQHD